MDFLFNEKTQISPHSKEEESLLVHFDAIQLNQHFITWAPVAMVFQYPLRGNVLYPV